MHAQNSGRFALVDLQSLLPSLQLVSPMLHDDTVGELPTYVNRQCENSCVLLPTASVLPISAPMDPTFVRKSLYVLRENIRALLDARKEDQKTLADWCGHDKSWMNKFLNEGRGIRVGDFDKIASFFGIEVYQLFQPGISRVTERRKGDRRIDRERRIGVQARLASSLQLEVNKLPRLARQTDYDVSALPAPIQTLIKKAQRKLQRDIAAYEAKVAREQAPSARRKIAGAPQDRGNRGGPDPKTA